jgi:hypothetical protein
LLSFAGSQVRTSRSRGWAKSSCQVGIILNQRAQVTPMFRNCNFRLTSGKMIVVSLESFINHQDVDFRRMDLHRRIALVLRKEPGLVRDFAERLRSKLAASRSAAAASDTEWEWYIILTLWSPLQVIKLLEDFSEQHADRLIRNIFETVDRAARGVNAVAR